METGKKIRIVFGNDVVGPNRNNHHHGSDKRSFTYVDTANLNEVFFVFQVKFRAYGGGGGGSVEVRSVSVSPGQCGSSGNIWIRKE